MMAQNLNDPLPISLVAHTVFCERRAWLESVGESVASINIEAGVADHARVDARSDDRTVRRQSVDVASVELGVVGRCDVVEENSDGGVRVVEFKSAPQRRSSVVTQAQRIQLAIQGVCLEEAGRGVSGYGVFFTTSRRMIDVDLDATDFDEARRVVARTRAVVSADTAPPPLVGDARCGRCSHAGVCLPDERPLAPVRRRIIVSDPESTVLHLTVPGSRASLKAGRVVVVRGDEELASLPLERVDGVVVHGNVDLSSALVRELLWRQSSVVWASGRGTVIGYARSAKSPNGGPRVSQHARSAAGDIVLARELVAAKIANQATVLRRFARDEQEHRVKRIRALQRAVARAEDVPSLLGVEGEAASVYFSAWRGMVRAEGAWLFHEWPGRVGRGATDPLNVCLNVVYGLLLADVVRSIITCGLDPHAGFVHSSSRNKPALALDLMEQFRPVVADAVVLAAVNNGELRPQMFTDVLGGHRLRDAGRRALVAAYERRVRQEFTHPIFGYKVSWRRAMEIQSRLVLGVIDGTQAEYRGIRVR